MGQQTLVFNAELVGFDGVHRTIAIRDDLTLVDLHYALQSAFDWDDDHLYAFWSNGAFWSTDCEHYLHPLHAPSTDARCRSAYTPLVELGLDVGDKIAYVFDFASEWRVVLIVQRAVAASGRMPARVLESVGQAPPQYTTVPAEGEIR
jgi:Plasmid pRiA4b ORF-3-like protein